MYMEKRQNSKKFSKKVYTINKKYEKNVKKNMRKIINC